MGTHICNPAEGSDSRSSVNIFLPCHVFSQAVKYHTKEKYLLKLIILTVKCSKNTRNRFYTLENNTALLQQHSALKIRHFLGDIFVFSQR